LPGLFFFYGWIWLVGVCSSGFIGLTIAGVAALTIKGTLIYEVLI